MTITKIIKKIPGCARTSIVTYRNDKGARRSNSGSAGKRSGSSSSNKVAVTVAIIMAIIPAVAAAIAAAVAAAKQQRQQLRQLQQSQQITVIATRSYQHQHHTSTSSISSSCISYINISSSSWCYWCFTGVGKTNACSKSTIRPRNSNGSCCNNNRMGKKVCQLLSRFMPSYLSWILPWFWLRSKTQNQMRKRNRRIKKGIYTCRRKTET